MPSCKNSIENTSIISQKCDCTRSMSFFTNSIEHRSTSEPKVWLPRTRPLFKTSIGTKLILNPKCNFENEPDLNCGEDWDSIGNNYFPSWRSDCREPMPSLSTLSPEHEYMQNPQFNFPQYISFRYHKYWNLIIYVGIRIWVEARTGQNWHMPSMNVNGSFSIDFY